MLTESVVLAALGCASGLAVALGLGRYLLMLMPSNFIGQLGVTRPQIDVRVLCFAITISLLAGVLAGVGPALNTVSNAPQAVLKEGGRSSDVAGRRSGSLLSAFVIGEIALALVLLMGAGLMLKSFWRLQHRDLGFDAHGLLTLRITLPQTSYPPGARRSELLRRLLEEVQSAPGVAVTGATTVNPLGAERSIEQVVIEGMDTRGGNATYNVNHRLVSPDLFHAMNIPLLRGRNFTEQDDDRAQPVVIVSEQMAKRFWPQQDALGKRIRVAQPGAPWLVVTGVAGNVRNRINRDGPTETWYLPYAQQATTSEAESVYLMIRSRTDALSILPAVQQALWRVDRTLATYNVSAMDHYYSESLRQERLGAKVVTLFGAFGLVLAGLGVYGVTAFSVAQRTHEIGVRMALGAEPAGILWLVIRRGVRLSLIGLVVGVMTTAALNRVLASLLLEIQPLEVAMIILTSLGLLAIAFGACYFPARKAAGTDPMVALRYE